MKSETANAPQGQEEKHVTPRAPTEGGFSYDMVHRVAWPIFERQDPVLAEGSTKLDKPFIFRLRENLWNSVDEHCKRLGVGKSEWVREAILRQMYEEQRFFSK